MLLFHPYYSLIDSSFFIHRCVAAFAMDIAATYGKPDHQAMLFPNALAARRCLDFIHRETSSTFCHQIFVVNLALDSSKDQPLLLTQLSPTVSAVMFPGEAFSLAKQYWQHTGDGISSRRAQFCHTLFSNQLLIPTTEQQFSTIASKRPLRGPRRYLQPVTMDGYSNDEAIITSSSPGSSTQKPNTSSNEAHESYAFLEERFGRNLDLSLVDKAKSAIRKRIAGSLARHDSSTSVSPLNSQLVHSNDQSINELNEDDVYLFPAGMNAIFHTHRALLAALGPYKSINFGFPYVDTLKILEKFGPGCVFYGNASAAELDELEGLLRSGQRFLALFCEFPGNPLLTCPDLQRIRNLAHEFEFAVVVDDTIGTFANVNVVPFADIIVSSLTKIFSGDCNVMGGSATLNHQSRHYNSLKKALDGVIYEDVYWPEDVVFMERNSRDFMDRMKRINANAEAICDVLRGHPLVGEVYYPKHNSSRHLYEVCRLPDGGYGGLLSVVFKQSEQAQRFYDSLDTAKGPSLGTNFTLCSPYVLLAHYNELPWAAQFGVDANLIRISVGLEETEVLRQTFLRALEVNAAEHSTNL